MKKPVLLLLMLSIMLPLMPRAMAAETGDTVTIPIPVEINGQSEIHIAADVGSPAYPTPTLAVDRETTLVFEFSEEGDFAYTVSQTGSDPAVVYDTAKYRIQFQLSFNQAGQLEGTVGLHKVGSEFKETQILFQNELVKTEEETTTVTRSIIYKEYDENGREIFVRVKQTVTLKRSKTTHPDGTVTYGPWEISSGSAPAVDSPPYPGWTPDKAQVPQWDIDLTDPKDETVYVFYTPDPTEAPIQPTTPPSPLPDTGDDFSVAWPIFFSGAFAGLVLCLAQGIKKREEI